MGGTTTQVTAAYGNTIGDMVLEAWESSLTGAEYLNWVWMGKYPVWWGPNTGGLEQFEKMLAFDNEYTQRSCLPAVTKRIFEHNISTAMNWVREQRAAHAARSGGTSVAH